MVENFIEMCRPSGSWCKIVKMFAPWMFTPWVPCCIVKLVILY